MRDKVSNYEASGYRNYYNNYGAYNRSSVAYNAYPTIYDDTEKAVPYRKRESRVSKKEKRERIFHKMRLILSVIIIFGGCILMMCSYTSVHEQRIENSRLRDELIQLQNQNSSIAADMTADLSVDYIRDEAINRLGMVEPQDYQIVYIDVDEQSYTVSYAEKEAEEDEGFTFSGLIKFLKGE